MAEYKECVNKILDTLSESEAYLIRLVFQYGFDGDSLLKYLELPEWETIKYCIFTKLLNKAIRKLRHPSRSRKLKDYLE